MCDILIPALIIAGVALAAGTLSGGGACAPVCAPVCPPQAAYTYTAAYSEAPCASGECAPKFTTAARNETKVAGFNHRGVPIVNADNRYSVMSAMPPSY